MRSTTALLVALSLSGTAVAQPPYQQLVSDMASGEEYTHQAFAYADGSTLVQQWSDTFGLFCTRYDATGIPLWRRVISPSPDIVGWPPMTITPDGGFVIATARVTQSDSGLVDLSKYDALGATQWSKSILVASAFGTMLAGPCAVASSSAGEIFLVNLASTNGSFVTKLSGTGATLWTQHITDPGLDTGIGTLIDVEALDDGGCILLGPGASGTGFALGRLDANGATVWMKSFAYTTPDSGLDNLHIEPRPGGQCIVTAALYVGNTGPYALVIKMDLNGNIAANDFYEFPTPPHVYGFRGLSLGNGELFLIGGYYGSVNAWCARIDSTGQLMNAAQVRTVVTGASTNRIFYLATDVANDSLHMAGDLLTTDTIFGTQTSLHTVWKSAPDMTGLCTLDPLGAIHYSVPAGVITSTDVGAVQSVVFPAIPLSVGNTPQPLPTTSSYCGLVGVEEEPATVDFVLFPDPVAHSGHMTVITQVIGRIEVFDATGRAQHSSAVVPGTTMLPSPATAGFYAVRFTPTHGAAVVRNLIVE